MDNIGLICGGGRLPILIGKNLLNKNLNVIFFVISEFFIESDYRGLDVEIIHLNSLKKIIETLENRKINNLIMLGNLNRPSLSDIKFDLETIKFAKNLLLEKKGDNQLLISIKKLFEKKGFNFFDWRKYCQEFFSIEKNISKIKPSKKAIENCNKAIEVFKNFGNLDIGQSLVVQNQIILGLEASEGTDELIKRCNEYKKKGDKGILVKFNKHKQSSLLDIASIGMNTVKLIKQYNYEGIFLEQSKCLIIDKEDVIKFANSNNIFISTVNKFEQ